VARKQCPSCGGYLPSSKRKNCSCCNKRKKLADFTKNRSCKGGRENICKECRRKTIRDWQKANPEKVKAYIRKSNKNRADREGSWAFTSVWWKSHPKAKREYERRTSQKRRRALADHYVKSILQRTYGFSYREIPAELTNRKREQLQVFRTLRSFRARRNREKRPFGRF
jgi:hypothetical protein